MARIGSAIVGFGRFWYRFIVGDDWTVAVAIVLGLLLTLALRVSRVPAWWLMPLVVIVVLGLSLRRARPA